MITLVIPYNPLDELSGLQNLAKRWATALTSKGFQVEILTTGSSGEHRGARIIGFPNLPLLCLAVLRRPNEQVVHWMEVWPSRLGVCLQYLTAVTARRRGQTHTLGTGTPGNLRRRGWIPRARNALCYIFDGFVVPNRDFVPEYLDCGIPPDQVTHVPQGLLRTEPFRPLTRQERQEVCQRLGLDPACRYVIYLGRMVARKRPLDFIEAAKAALNSGCSARFLLVGESWNHEDSIDQSVHRAVDEVGGDDITIHSHTNKPWDYLAVADLVVLTSERDGEAFVVIEALASGATVLVPDIPVLRTFHNDLPIAVGMYPLGDVNALACRIVAELEDHSARAKAKLDGPAYVASHRQLDELIDRYTARYGPRQPFLEVRDG